MLYYLRVARKLYVANLKENLEYKANALLYIFNAVLTNVLSLIFFWAVISRFQSLHGWTLREIFFIFSLRLVGHGVYMLTFFSQRSIPSLVRHGELDRMLLQPISPLFLISLLFFSPPSIGDMGTGIICLIIALKINAIAVTGWTLLFLALVIMGAALIEAALALILCSLVFWFNEIQRGWFLLEIFNDSFALYPLSIFNVTLQVMLTFLIPVAFLGFMPATAFLGRTSEVPFAPVLAYLTPVVGIVFFGIAYSFWRVGVRHYQGTGS